MSAVADRHATVDREVGLLEAELLRGVALTARELAQAHDIIRGDVELRRTIRPPQSDGPWAAWDRSIESMRARDARLSDILSTDPQRASFAANLAQQQQMLAELRQRAERNFLREQGG